MKFRPCIDIHNGKVKQIVGGSLKGDGSVAQENFVSGHDAAWFARFYLQDKLEGGHIIMLNPVSAPEYRATKEQALAAIQAAPGSFQLGGGVTPYNAEEFLNAGASKLSSPRMCFRTVHLTGDIWKRSTRRWARNIWSST